MKIVYYNDGRVGFFVRDLKGYQIWHHKTPDEAVEVATKIINHSYPHTTAVKSVATRRSKNGTKPKGTKIMDPGPAPLKRTFSGWDTTEGRMDYVNQGCHRPWRDEEIHDYEYERD